MKTMRLSRHTVLVFGSLTFICIGVVYSWSKFSTDIRGDLGFNQAQITLIYTICIALFSFGITVDGFLSKLCAAKTSVTCSCLLVSTGYFCTSLLSFNTRLLIYLTYGAFVGLGVGVVYGGWLSNIMLWFPKGRGLATGILLTAIGFSGLTITPVLAAITSLYSWRRAFQLMSVLFLFLAALSRFFFVTPDQLPGPAGGGEAAWPPCCYTTGEVIRRHEFWIFCAWKLLLVGVGQALMGQIAPIIADTGGGDSIQLLCVSLSVFINGVSRTIWGLVSDLSGYKLTLSLIGVCGTVAIAGLRYAVAGSLTPLAFLCLLLYLSAFGGAASIGPGLLRTFYGQRDFRTTNGISTLTVFPGNLIITPTIGFIRTSAGSYLPFFSYALPAAAAATVFSFLISSPPSKNDPQQM